MLSVLFIFARAWAKRLARLERSVAIVIFMLREHGLKVPDRSDTDIFLKSNNLYER